MKRLFCSMFLLVGIGCFSQTFKPGVFAAYTAGEARGEVSISGLGESDSTIKDGGFSIGVFLDVDLNEKFMVKPKLSYTFINDGHALQLPLLMGYRIIDKFKVLVGPQLNYQLEDVDGQLAGIVDFNEFSIGGTLGIEYDVYKNISLFADYSRQLTNSIPDSISRGGFNVDFDGRIHYFNIGAAYKF